MEIFLVKVFNFALEVSNGCSFPLKKQRFSYEFVIEKYIALSEKCRFFFNKIFERFFSGSAIDCFF